VSAAEEPDEMARKIVDHGRRHFVGTAAMAIAAARLGALGAAQTDEREPRELGAIGRAPEWINSPRLTAAGRTA